MTRKVKVDDIKDLYRNSEPVEDEEDEMEDIPPPKPKKKPTQRTYSDNPPKSRTHATDDDEIQEQEAKDEIDVEEMERNRNKKNKNGYDPLEVRELYERRFEEQERKFNELQELYKGLKKREINHNTFNQVRGVAAPNEIVSADIEIPIYRGFKKGAGKISK